MKLIIGLGNPGPEYALTRHNAGFLLVDALAEKLNLTWETDKKSNSLIAKNSDYLLVKPLTFMNNSGQTAQALLSYYKLPITSLIIAHDDLDVDLGKYKIATNSRAAGHNGVQSIINHLGTQEITRYRLGIRQIKTETFDPLKIPSEKFVLQKFTKTELEITKQLILEIISTL